jgi:hypothetical protein
MSPIALSTRLVSTNSRWREIGEIRIKSPFQVEPQAQHGVNQRLGLDDEQHRLAEFKLHKLRCGAKEAS